MFQENIIFYDEYADYIETLEKLEIFERAIDIVFLGTCIGVLFDKKSKNSNSSKNKKEIFASTVNNESENFKMLAIISYLKNVNINNSKHEQLMIELFLDLENSLNYDEHKTCLRKYDYLKEYMYGGLKLLYEMVMKDAYDEIDQLRNLEKFLEQIEQIKNKGSVKIIESLLIR